MRLSIVGAMLGASLASLATSCGRTYTVVRRYQLSAAPPTTFALLPQAGDGVYDVKRERLSPHVSDPCPGFSTYKLSQDRAISYFHARLISGESPTLELAYGYQTGNGVFGGGKPNPGLESEQAYWADIVARLVLQGSGVEPVVPTGDEVRLTDWKAVKLWCAKD